MSKILFISSHLPCLKVPEAGQKIANSRIKEYKMMGHDVYLLTFVNSGEKKYLTDFDTSMLTDCLVLSVTKISRIINILLKPSLPVKVSSRYSKKGESWLREKMAMDDISLVHFEFTSAAVYLPLLKNVNCPKTIVEHDVVYQSYERKVRYGNIISRLFYFFEKNRQKKWELRTLGEMDTIIVLNSKDQKLLTSDQVDDRKISIAYPVVEDFYYQINRSNIEKNSLLFWGALNRKENQDAIKWFLKHIFPRVVKMIPDVKFYIVGANPPGWLKDYMTDSIVVTGFVEDPKIFFEKGELAVVPLRMGAGIKIKVLEFLAAKIPVVTTSVGAEGIESDLINIADDEYSFASAISTRLSST